MVDLAILKKLSSEFYYLIFDWLLISWCGIFLDIQIILILDLVWQLWTA